MTATTEGLLTQPGGFGIATPTPAQRAACRILDGRPLGELATHSDVIALVGGPAAVAQLPSERGIVPSEVVLLAAVRTAKTMIACAAALRMTQTVDVSKLGPGEVPRVSLVSLKLDVTAVPHRLLLETIRESALLQALLLDATADVITIKHPSGRPIEIAIVAGAKAGAGLVARWSAGVIFDEAPRMNGSSDAVVNLDHARSAVLGRLLPGAQVLYIGSPWAPHGPVYSMVQQHWGKPTDRMVVLRGTGPMLNPRWWTAERCARVEAQDPIAYQCDVMGEFADPEAGLLEVAAVLRNTRPHPETLDPEPGAVYAAAMDPSSGVAGGNAWTLVIVAKTMLEQPRASLSEPHPADRPHYAVALAREWRGVRPEQVLAEVASLCRRYRIDSIGTDQYSGAALADLARRFSLTVDVTTTTSASKLQAYTDLATLISSDQVELPPDRTFRRDLLSIRRRVTQQSMAIHLPKTADGRHCDYAPALVQAIARAAVAVDWSDFRPRPPAVRRSGPFAGEPYSTLRLSESDRGRRALGTLHVFNAN